MSTGPVRKTAIAVPAEVLDEVDRAARESGMSRSRYISRVLALAVRARTNQQITRRLDALFADESVAAEQQATAAQLDHAGSRWDDERWCSAAARSTGSGSGASARNPRGDGPR